MIHTVKKIIVPSRIIYQRKLYKIIKIDKKYIIKGYIFTIINDRIISLMIKNLHPNADSSGEFCLNKEVKNISDIEKAKPLLEQMLSTFNLDDCYFTPFGEIEYQLI